MRRSSAAIGAAPPRSILGYVVRGQRLAGVVVPPEGEAGRRAFGRGGAMRVEARSLNKHGGLLLRKKTVESNRGRICTIIMQNNYDNTEGDTLLVPHASSTI